jgi:hypothetical protein
LIERLTDWLKAIWKWCNPLVKSEPFYENVKETWHNRYETIHTNMVESCVIWLKFDRMLHEWCINAIKMLKNDRYRVTKYR